MAKPGDIFIIVPVYNEATSISSVLEELLAGGYEIICVDDGSRDESAKVISRYPVYLLTHEINIGQGAALQTGITFARTKNASIVVTFDADGQHQAGDIEALIRPILIHEADVVLGSRFLKGAKTNASLFRRQALLFARWLNYLLSGLMLSDAHNGLRAFSQQAIHQLEITEPGMAHASEIHLFIAKHKLRLKEVPVTINYTEYSRGKGQSGWNGIRVFFDLLIHKFSR